MNPQPNNWLALIPIAMFVIAGFLIYALWKIAKAQINHCNDYDALYTDIVVMIGQKKPSEDIQKAIAKLEDLSWEDKYATNRLKDLFRDMKTVKCS